MPAGIFQERLWRIMRNDFEVSAAIVGQIRIIKPATDRILAYETWLLEVVDWKTEQALR